MPSMRNATEPPRSPSFQSTAPAGRAVSVPTRASSAKMICCICSDKGSSEGHDIRPLAPSAGVQSDHPLDGPPAHGAEADLVAGEHGAVDLGAVVAVRLVDRAFEGAHLARIWGGAQELAHPLAFFPEERLHLRLRALLLPDLSPASLDVPLGGLELLLRPRRGEGNAGGHEVPPLGRLRVG